MLLIKRRSAIRQSIHHLTVTSSALCYPSDNTRMCPSKSHVNRYTCCSRRHPGPCSKQTFTPCFSIDSRQINTFIKSDEQARLKFELLTKSKSKLRQVSETESNNKINKIVGSNVNNDTSVIVSLMIGEDTEAQKKEANNSKESQDCFDYLHESLDDISLDVAEMGTANKYISDHVESANDVEEDYYNDDFIEEISLDVNTAPKLNKTVTKDYSGKPDPSSEISSVPCPGCGAKLHCKETGVPGYMPSEKYKCIPKKKLREYLCQRCFLMNTYNIALNARVSADEYPRIISQIKRVQNALVLVIVDLTDMTNSIFKNTLKLIGHHPVYVIGNKVDLLPRDKTGYLERTKKALVQECINSGFPEKRIRHSCLISGKTGYGVEELVTKLMNDWQNKGHVYVVGCTNAGKSTIFNALLSSDYCKSQAADHIKRATTSIWPGTTLNLLEFPIVTPSPYRLYKRTERLLREREAIIEEQRLRKNMLRETGHKRYATLMGHIGQTFRNQDGEDYEGHTLSTYTATASGDIKATAEGRQTILPSKGEFNDAMFGRSKWCHDTPGVVNTEQIINLLSQEELVVLLSQQTIKPRTFVLKPTQVMFVSGLGRVDYIKGPQSIYFTVFSSTSLPVHVTNCDEADSFFDMHYATDHLKLPIGDIDRLNRLPSLVGKEFSVSGIGWKESACDITLSSIGWFAVTAGHSMQVKLRVFTPGGAGLHLRQPSVLRYAVNLKGKRIGKSAAYEVRKPNFKLQ